MNIYHITYAPEDESLYLHFWGCNMHCRGCLCKVQVYDCHLKETENINEKGRESINTTVKFLSFHQVFEIIKVLKFNKVIFMGMEPSLDPELPGLAKALREEFRSYNIILTNGLKLFPLDYIDEIVLSIKAYSDELYKDYTGVSSKRIKDNFQKIYSKGKRLKAESVLIPDYIDVSEIEQIARFIAGVDRKIPYRIDAYFPVAENPWRRATPEDVEEAVKIAKKYLLDVSCTRGDEELMFDVVRIY